jgi:hypothetical protein
MFRLIFGLSTILASGQTLLAHNLEVKGNIAITFHIEPNHNPKVGKPAQAWFLLTRPGGKIVPLSECDCRLSLFLIQPKPINLGDLPLKAIAAEKYNGIPGAEIIFNQAGLYQLKLEGKPKGEQDFQPFQTSYKVTVTK